jgi:hypothetical protein
MLTLFHLSSLHTGDTDEVARQQKTIHSIAAKYGGIVGGAENGKRGYLLTFVIAYIRDIAFDYRYIAESFETSCPHSCVDKVSEVVGLRLCVRAPVPAPPPPPPPTHTHTTHTHTPHHTTLTHTYCARLPAVPQRQGQAACSVRG